MDTNKPDINSPVYRYDDGEKPWEPVQGEECIEEISDHIEKHIGAVDMVFHEIISDTVHIDIHHVRPTEERPFHTLVTSGMSDLPMTLPEGADVNPYMELMVTLPPEWKLTQNDFKDERWYWPVRQLKFLARFPHKFDTWLYWGHTIPNGDPAEPYADGVPFDGVIILPPITVPDDFLELEINEEKTIHFFSMVPLYPEEMDFKLKKGTEALLDKFDTYGVSERIDLSRKNTVKKRWGIF